MIDCFDHGDNIVHMGKTIAQKGAHVVKDGISMLLLLGIPPKLIFLCKGHPADATFVKCKCIFKPHLLGY